MLFFYPYYMYLSCRTKNFVKSIYIETSLRRKKVDFTEFLSKCSAQSGNAQVWQSLKFTLNEVFFRLINSLVTFTKFFEKSARVNFCAVHNFHIVKRGLKHDHGFYGKRKNQHFFRLINVLTKKLISRKFFYRYHVTSV